MMGLFDFFKSKKEEPKEVKHSIPTIKPEKEIYDCYAEAFKRDFANVSGISPEEKSQILKFISGVEGGFLNMGAYHSQVYDKYFKGRVWAWAEYDKWNDRFTKLGRFPTSFQSISPISKELALDLLTAAELKDLLKSKNIAFTSKAKKQDLIDLANGISDVSNEAIVQVKIAEALEKQRYSVYTILMRTINFRSKNPYDYNRAKSIGVNKFEIIQIHEADHEFADMALKENPNALPPLYPYDMSWLKSVIDFK